MPPTPVILPVAEDGEAFSFRGVELPTTGRDRGRRLAAFATVLVSLFFLGQGLRLADDRRAMEARWRRSRPICRRRQRPGQTADRRRLAAYAEIEGRTNPLTASGAALGIMALYEIEPTGLETDAETLTVKAPYAALGTIDELVSEFETSGYFYDVEPQTDAAHPDLDHRDEGPARRGPAGITRLNRQSDPADLKVMTTVSSRIRFTEVGEQAPPSAIIRAGAIV